MLIFHMSDLPVPCGYSTNLSSRIFQGPMARCFRCGDDLRGRPRSLLKGSWYSQHPGLRSPKLRNQTVQAGDPTTITLLYDHHEVYTVSTINPSETGVPSQHGWRTGAPPCKPFFPVAMPLARENSALPVPPENWRNEEQVWWAESGQTSTRGVSICAIAKNGRFW